MAALTIGDICVGREIALGPYIVTRHELLDFAQVFDPQPFHLDEVAATSSVLGGLATSGWHTSSIIMRMVCDAFFLHVNAIGSTGIDEMKWLKPVYVDDELSGTLTFTAVRRSVSKPDRIIVNFDVNIRDQKRESKAFMRSMVLVEVNAP
jgi:acyl dehydratase